MNAAICFFFAFNKNNTVSIINKKNSNDFGALLECVLFVTFDCVNCSRAPIGAKVQHKNAKKT